MRPVFEFELCSLYLVPWFVISMLIRENPCQKVLVIIPLRVLKYKLRKHKFYEIRMSPFIEFELCLR
jgi:hypothetical protein